MNHLDSSNTPPNSRSDTSASTDAQLLARYLEARDQAAFESLIFRHGPLVFGVCRRILKRHHDAEEAFQITFLTLARQATRIAQPEMLASWLHTVARHAALKLKKSAVKRQHLEQQAEESMDTFMESQADQSELWADVAPVLDMEMGRLSDELRIAVILCDVEGKTRKEAARQLGWNEATLSSRLMKARSLLAQRLTRRGITLSVAALSVLLAQNAATAAVPGTLVATTATAASMVSAVNATATEAVFTKLIGFIKGTSQSVLAGKAALVTIAGTTIVAASLALQPEPKEQQPEVLAQVLPAKLASPFEEIADVYREHYATIKTITVEYQETREPLIDWSILWKSWQRYPVLPEKTLLTLAIDNEKVYFENKTVTKSFNHIMNKILEQHSNPTERDAAAVPGPVKVDTSFITSGDIIEQIPKAPIETEEHTWVYDGHLLRDYRSVAIVEESTSRSQKMNAPVPISSLPMFQINIPSQVNRAMFHVNYLDMMLFGITGSALPQDRALRTRFRLPELLSQDDWQVVAEHEAYDGADCLVIKSARGRQVWLDRSAGFAVRRWTAEPIPEYPRKVDYDCRDFRQVAPNTWMPQCIIFTEYGDESMPMEFRGMPVWRVRFDASTIEINQPLSEDRFEVVPAEGAVVFDHTLQPLDASGQPVKVQSDDGTELAVSYYQPANAADIPLEARRAQIKLGTHTQSAKTSQTLPSAVRWFIAINLLLIAGGYFVYRRSAS